MSTTVSRYLVGLLAATLLSSCATPRFSGPTRGVPGFDTREFPGAETLAAWREASPYEWVGYYLEAPCRPESSWMGTRETLRSQGWGIAVLYVGEQAWAEAVGETTPAEEGAQCTRRNLTAEKGRLDAQDAIRTAVSEGFPNGTTVFLDVEHVATVTDAQVEYVRAWVEEMLRSLAYRPGLYVHAANVDTLFAVVSDAYAAAGRNDTPPMWIASSRGFGLDRLPTESGFDFATVWQGRFDVEESWGGERLRIDVNVADPGAPFL